MFALIAKREPVELRLRRQRLRLALACFDLPQDCHVRPQA